MVTLYINPQDILRVAAHSIADALSYKNSMDLGVNLRLADWAELQG